MIQTEYRIKKAADYEAQDKNLHAVQIYRNIINENPEYPLAYLRLSGAYEKLRNSEAAISLLKNYLQNISDDKEIRLYLGQLLLKYSMWADAVDILSVINPDEQPLVLFFQGYSYYMMKNFDQAKITFREYITNNPNPEFFIEAFIYIARSCIELMQYDEALECAQKADDVSNTNWEVKLLLAVAYYHKGMYLHSVNSIEKAIKLNKDEISLLEWAGKAYLKLGDYLKAEEYLLKFVTNADISSEAYSFLGLACLNSQKLDDAKNYFDIALKLDPSNEIALEGIKKFS